jgi:ABC-type transporter Mla maintaining outer membrane lipid asymmetry ATPase subunit MlaF
MNAPPSLVFDDVPLGRAGRPATIAVSEHESVAVLGDEDSGVDRLGSWALGLERPPRGAARVFGTVVADLPERERLAFRRRLGYLPAGDGLLQNLSLRDNVALPLRFGSAATSREIDGRVRVMLAAVRLTDAAGRRPAAVHEEERRRAAFARAMAFDPPLLVLEQPFDGLTTRSAAELLELARGGVTAAGSRRAILITGQDLPALLQRRLERVYRVTRDGMLEPELV